MHDLVRAYAAAQAHTTLARSVRRSALDRVVDFYLHTAYSADRCLQHDRPPIRLDPPAPGTHPRQLSDYPSAMAWLDAHHSHLLAAQRAAVDHHRYRAVWNLAWTLHTFHRRQGHHHDELAVWQVAAAADHLPDHTTRIRTHQFLGRAQVRLGRHDQGIEHLGQALTLAELHDDTTP
ncbi:hypothetical protein ACQPZF_10470 [Actinosynnema sp. CS-041913]|uniref:hypothetical protein n=1 Tax=Actinosynnema sp. CS-041913 TaxID=3239917 RepID=UPI003D8C352E